MLFHLNHPFFLRALLLPMCKKVPPLLYVSGLIPVHQETSWTAVYPYE